MRRKSPRSPVITLLSVFAAAVTVLIGLGAPAQAQSCPNWSLSGSSVSYGAEGLWTPRSFGVTAGGGTNLGNCGNIPGRGWVSAAPDFELDFFENNARRDLEFRTQGSCDTVLLVNDASGQWHFNDDGGSSLNASMRLSNAPTGTYDIWVGTYGSSNCSTTLVMETFGGGGSSGGGGAGVCPDWSLSGSSVRYGAEGLWTPRSFGVTAGGGTNLGNCGNIPGRGWVGAAPDFELDFFENNARRDLEFRTQGSCDTVLLVNDASGQWHFNDDGGSSLNASMRLSNAATGTYDIWVGTYGSSNCSTTLVMETFGGGGAQVLPDPGNLTSYRQNVGQTLQFQVTGSTNGPIWGTGIYTDDTALSVAAVHAGVLRPGQTGVIAVEVLPGQPSYTGTVRNGISSNSYGSWQGSYRILGQR
ncbi:hypothetical protein C2I36_15205 [Rhodobacteraceae bacterium WD3A24]|nr:hypothetical protein C2I36_15205 [Rhodobacteraceae bacterium WD3A24]